MASSTIRKAIGAVKDQTSIGLAMVSSNFSPHLDVAIVKATSHDDWPANEKHIREILNLASYSRGYANACVSTISRRLGKTRDWIVALKTLMLIHRLLNEGAPSFHHELLYASRRGTRLLNMSDFRDETHFSSWDHSAFIRAYALYLDQRLECIVHDQMPAGGGNSGGKYGRNSKSNFFSPQGEERRSATPLGEMMPEKVLDRMNQLQQLFDRFLACRPIGLAKNNRMISVALCPIVKESFQLYADICEILAVLLDRYFDVEYADCVKSFESYGRATKQIDELNAFYGWCKDTGVARSSEYPAVQRIADKFLETLEEFMRDRATRLNSPPRHLERALTVQEEEPVQDMNIVKALPAPSDYEAQQVSEEPKPMPRPYIQPQPQGDLIDLREDAGTEYTHGNKLAVALFSTGAAGTGNWKWEAFPSESSGEGEMTSASQTTAADEGNADWELALVETASKLAKQKTAFAGGFDPLVRQHVSAHTNISSVALPGHGKMATPVLALPAPDDTVHNNGGDPFAASLNIPPPSYVQMSDIEKQQKLMQEQQLWPQYTHGGMQGQVSLVKLNNAHYYPNPVM